MGSRATDRIQTVGVMPTSSLFFGAIVQGQGACMACRRLRFESVWFHTHASHGSIVQRPRTSDCRSGDTGSTPVGAAIHSMESRRRRSSTANRAMAGLNSRLHVHPGPQAWWRCTRFLIGGARSDSLAAHSLNILLWRGSGRRAGADPSKTPFLRGMQA